MQHYHTATKRGYDGLYVKEFGQIVPVVGVEIADFLWS